LQVLCTHRRCWAGTEPPSDGGGGRGRGLLWFGEAAPSIPRPEGAYCKLLTVNLLWCAAARGGWVCSPCTGMRRTRQRDAHLSLHPQLPRLRSHALLRCRAHASQGGARGSAWVRQMHACVQICCEAGSGPRGRVRCRDGPFVGPFFCPVCLTETVRYNGTLALICVCASRRVQRIQVLKSLPPPGRPNSHQRGHLSTADHPKPDQPKPAGLCHGRSDPVIRAHVAADPRCSHLQHGLLAVARGRVELLGGGAAAARHRERERELQINS
jgi:hypothetical protein